MLSLATRGKIVASTLTDTTARFTDAMPRLLFTGGPADVEVALPECLVLSKLDFSLESLHVIDQYLNDVHDNEQNVAGLSLLTTIWATALYVGEIIRRETPARQFEWVTIGEDLSTTGTTTSNHSDVGTVRALRARDGEMCMPSRAVLRVILRGRKARSIDSYARGAIESSLSDPRPAGAMNQRREPVRVPTRMHLSEQTVNSAA